MSRNATIKFQQFTMTWEEQRVKGKHYRVQSRTIYAFGKTKKQIETMAKTKYDEIKRYIEENSNEPNIKRRKWSYGKEGSVLQQQPSQNKSKVKMRHYVVDIDTGNPQTWDTRTGRCVFDYLMHIYGEIDGFKKIMRYDRLADIFSGDEIEDNDPLNQGVSVEQLKKFCELTGTPMYAFDGDDETIEYFKPSRRGKGPALIYKVMNRHLYPIEDVYERQRLQAKGSHTEEKSFSSKQIEENTGDKDKPSKIYNIIAPPEILVDGEVQNYNQDEANQFALEQIFSRNKIPTYVNDKSLYFADGRIERIKIGDDMILTEPVNPVYQKFVEDRGGVYQGEQPVLFLYELWEECFGSPMTESMIKSKVNPQILKTLLLDGVKYRTHYGATDDLAEYLVNVNPEFAEVVEEEIIEEVVNYNTPFGENKTKKQKTKNKKVKKVKLEPKTRIEQMLETGEAVCCDIEKCYASLLVNPMDNWIIFDDFDEITLYTETDGDLPLGLYFVETEDMSLLHKSNWYSNKILDFARQEQIPFNIIYQIKVVEKFNTEEEKYKFNNKSAFNDIIEFIIDKTEDNIPLRKLIINQLTGCLGKTQGAKLKVNLTTDINEVWDKFVIPNAEKNRDIFIQRLEYQDKSLWINGHTELKEWNEINLPMYIQILDWSNIKLYKMGKIIGGNIIFRKTDCIVSIGGKIPDSKIIDTLCIPNSMTKEREIINEDDEEDYEEYEETYERTKSVCQNWGCIRIENGANFNYSSPMKTDRAVVTPIIENLWVTYPYNDSDDWNNIISKAKEKGGMLVLGRAGTGKTYVIHKAIEAGLLQDNSQRRLSFTNRASRNIDGTTIHKALAINSNGKTNRKSLSKFKAGEIVVVDEISMLNLELWKHLEILKKKGCIFILLGDYRQCKPIEAERTDVDAFDYFNSPIVKYLVNNNRCELNVRKRYDKPLWDYAEDFYERGIVGDQIEKRQVSFNEIYNSKNICYLNKTRMFINALCMNHYKKGIPHRHLPIPEKPERKESNRVPIEKDKEHRQDTFMYIGLPVMSVKNNTKLEIINSEEFVVVEMNDETFVLKREEEDEELTFEYDDFHKYFVVNYCATTHKSQGATIDIPIILWDWKRLTEDKNVGYTAITRAKKLSQLCIGTTPLDK